MKEIFEIATRVSTPIALISLVVTILFFVFLKIIDKEIYPKLTRYATSTILKMIIEKVFILSLVVTVLGSILWGINIIKVPQSENLLQYTGYILDCKSQRPIEGVLVKVPNRSDINNKISSKNGEFKLLAKSFETKFKVEVKFILNGYRELSVEKYFKTQRDVDYICLEPLSSGNEGSLVQILSAQIIGTQGTEYVVSPSTCTPKNPCTGNNMVRGVTLYADLNKNGFAAAYLQDQSGYFYNQQGELFIRNLKTGSTGLWPGTPGYMAHPDFKLWIVTSDQVIPNSPDNKPLKEMPKPSNGYQWGPIHLKFQEETVKKHDEMPEKPDLNLGGGKVIPNTKEKKDPPPPCSSFNYTGTWTGTHSGFTYNVILRQRGCNLTGTEDSSGFHHDYTGLISTTDGVANIQIKRRNPAGCVTVMSAILKINGNTMTQQVTGTDGKCDLPYGHTSFATYYKNKK